jgi:hypothetical protein
MEYYWKVLVVEYVLVMELKCGKRIVQEVNFLHELFKNLGRYEDNLIEKVAECKLFFI